MMKIFERFKGCILGGTIGDANCSIAGQIAGTLLGESEIPENLVSKLQ